MTTAITVASTMNSDTIEACALYLLDSSDHIVWSQSLPIVTGDAV